MTSKVYNKSKDNKSIIDVINDSISSINGSVTTINSDISTINTNVNVLTGLNADDVSLSQLTTELTNYPTKAGNNQMIGNNTFTGQNIFSGQTQLAGTNYVGSLYNTYNYLQGQTIVGTPDNSGSNALTVKCNSDFQANNTYTGNNTWSGYNISNGTTELRGNNIFGSSYNTGNTLKGTTNVGETGIGNFVVKCDNTFEVVPKLSSESLLTSITDSTHLVAKKYQEDNTNKKTKAERVVWCGATIWNGNLNIVVPPSLATTELREKKFLIRFNKQHYLDTNGTQWNATNSVTVECSHTINGTNNVGTGVISTLSLNSSRVINRFGIYTLHTNGKKTGGGAELSVQQLYATSNVRSSVSWTFNGAIYYYTPFTFLPQTIGSTVYHDRILVVMQMPMISNLPSEGNNGGVIASFSSSLRIISSLGYQQTYDINYYPDNTILISNQISDGGGAYIEYWNETV